MYTVIPLLLINHKSTTKPKPCLYFIWRLISWLSLTSSQASFIYIRDTWRYARLDEANFKYVYFRRSFLGNASLAVMRQPVIPCHDDVIIWKHFPHYWTFVREIHRPPVRHSKTALLCVRVLYHQATSHYLKQWQKKSVTSYGGTRPRYVNWVKCNKPTNNFSFLTVRTLWKTTIAYQTDRDKSSHSSENLHMIHYSAYETTVMVGLHRTPRGLEIVLRVKKCQNVSYSGGGSAKSYRTPGGSHPSN